MADMIEKKVWEKPELIAIVQCRPEESVLSVCKSSMRSCASEKGIPTSAIAAS